MKTSQARVLGVAALMMTMILSGNLTAFAAETGSGRLGEEQHKVELEDLCTATIDCWDDSVISCSGSSPCTYQSSSCPTEDGWVECGGVRTKCPRCRVMETCSLYGASCYVDLDCRPPGEPACDLCICIHQNPIGSCMCFIPAPE